MSKGFYLGQPLTQRAEQSQLDRIEAKLDALIAALAEDGDAPEFDLDGNPAGAERDQNAPL